MLLINALQTLRGRESYREFETRHPFPSLLSNWLSSEESFLVFLLNNNPNTLVEKASLEMISNELIRLDGESLSSLVPPAITTEFIRLKDRYDRKLGCIEAARSPNPKTIFHNLPQPGDFLTQAPRVSK